MKIELPPFINKNAFDNMFVTPFIEGIARIESAFKGTEIISFTEKKIPLSHRITYLVNGSVLLLPLFNGMFWVFLTTFGNPDKFSTTDKKQ